MTLPQIHKECQKIFSQSLYRDDKPYSIACDIYDKITDGAEHCEDCLGENFNSLIDTVQTEFFENYNPKNETKLDFYFNTYGFWLYSFVERIDFVFDLLNKDKQNRLFTDFQKDNFKTLADIKKWMNFIKHPKEFIFSHWPKYTFDEGSIPSDDKTIKIDLNFVREYYSQSKKKVEKLENQDQVYVLVPNLIELTENFCKELKIFIDFVCDNDIVAQYLKKKSSIEYFYEGQTDE